MASLVAQSMLINVFVSVNEKKNKIIFCLF